MHFKFREFFIYYDAQAQEWFKTREMPDVCHAQENGLLAFGGAYTPECFLRAYRRGIFPWPSGEPGEYIPWFCPAKRFVLEPENVHLSHSLKKTLKKCHFSVYADRQFEQVIRNCAQMPRHDAGTWITEGMIRTFCKLHEMGYAHSVECYEEDVLVGGFYGMCLGQIFGGESMFTHVSDASKVAFAVFAKRAAANGIRLIDCQCYTDNLARYGAHEISRDDFLYKLAFCRNLELPADFWQGQWL